MDEFLIFQRHGCEMPIARLAAVPLKNEIDLGRWHAINMAPLRGFIGQTPKQNSKKKMADAPARKGELGSYSHAECSSKTSSATSLASPPRANTASWRSLSFGIAGKGMYPRPS